MPERFVLDTSVAIKWFLRDAREMDTEKADRVLEELWEGRVELHAPRLLIYEFCHVLTRACRESTAQGRLRLEPQRLHQAIADFFALPIHFDHVDHEKPEAAARGASELAVRFHKGYYDMVFLRLAQHLHCPWLTADERAVQGVPDDFPKGSVRLLSHWP